MLLRLVTGVYKSDIKGGLPVTTKQSVREHGYGLKNVKKVLDKYISTLDFECSDERFTVKILMKI